MRVTQQEMEGSHARIVDGAARLMRERGVRGTSVADAMGEAGMTHGGFYRHFKTKDDLVIAALHAAFEGFAGPLESRQQQESPQAVVADYKSLYLSREHVENPGVGCPMPAMGGDLSREPDAVKAAFTDGFRRVVASLAQAHDGTQAERDAAAMRDIALLVGAVLLARATTSETASDVLAACRG